MFNSEQGTDATREHSFMPGDKVYVSKDGANIELLSPGEAGSPEALTGLAVTVSGLVVGKNTAGDTAAGGSYVFSGAGGLTADKASAHGIYVNNTDADDVDDDDYGQGDILKPTGKLEKFGDSTLTFLNAGTNAFMDGIELSGGTTRFTRAEQLYDGSYDPATGAATNQGGTYFLADSTLEALNGVELFNSVEIASGVTGTFSAAKDINFVYSGQLTGAGSLIKSGAGTLTLTNAANSYSGGAAVNNGVLRLTDTGAAGTGVNIVTGADGTLELAFAGTFNKNVTGSGGLSVDADTGGTVTLSGTNSYAGMTTVRSGTLELGSDLTASNGLTLHAYLKDFREGRKESRKRGKNAGPVAANFAPSSAAVQQTAENLFTPGEEKKAAAITPGMSTDEPWHEQYKNLV